MSIPWWRSHPIHENRATKSTKRATSIYEMTLFFIIRFLNAPLEKNLPFEIV